MKIIREKDYKGVWVPYSIPTKVMFGTMNKVKLQKKIWLLENPECVILSEVLSLMEGGVSLTVNHLLNSQQEMYDETNTGILIKASMNTIGLTLSLDTVLSSDDVFTLGRNLAMAVTNNINMLDLLDD